MDEQSIRLLLRITARVSFVFFLCAFAGGALYRLWPAPPTRRLAEGRHRALLGLAGSHTVHLAAIVALAVTIGGARFWNEVRWGAPIGGGIGFLSIYGLAADALSAGRISWLASPRFQSVAVYAIWSIFALTFVGRALLSIFYLPFVLAVLAALAIRLSAAWPRKPVPVMASARASGSETR